jgi:hypothetical protein
MSASNFKIKIIIDASPVKLEELFNDWVEEGGVKTIHIQPQVQYSPALQKFILSMMYTEREEEDAERKTDEQPADYGD